MKDVATNEKEMLQLRIDQTKSELLHKVAAIEKKAAHVRSSVSVGYHVQRHPIKALTGAVVVGLLLSQYRK